MSCKRITLKAIQDVNARKAALKKRMKGLLKKLVQIRTMCDVDVCLIMFIDAALETWPQDPSKVRSIVEKYEREKDKKPPKMFGLEDYFENRKNEVEAEISKVRKEIFQVTHPTWHTDFKTLREEQLRDFIAILDNKIEACNNQNERQPPRDGF